MTRFITVAAIVLVLNLVQVVAQIKTNNRKPFDNKVVTFSKEKKLRLKVKAVPKNKSVQVTKVEFEIKQPDDVIVVLNAWGGSDGVYKSKKKFNMVGDWQWRVNITHTNGEKVLPWLNINVIEDVPTTSPTKSPLSAPTKSPLPSPPECVLEATLGYPYSDPDESPHKGYNSDWLMVERGEGLNDDDYCWGGSNTDWCTVINTSGNSSMGAYIGNVDDYYADWAAEDDQVHNEIFTLRDVGAKTMWLKVNHFFLKKDYYTEFWNDHLMAAALTVTNKNNGKTLSPNGGWSYPVAPNVPTHIKNTAGKEIANPDYPHYFYVSVNCTEYCNCEAGDYEVFYGE